MLQHIITSAVPAFKRRILLVDEQVNRSEHIRILLEDSGYTVRRASGSELSLDSLGCDVPDVVVHVVDPSTQGCASVLLRLRESDPDLPLILITSALTLEAALLALDHRVSRFLVEPVESSSLLAAVQEAVATGISARARREALACMQLEASALWSLRQQLGRAVDRLWIAYQPIVRVSTGMTLAFEALMRSDERSLPDPKAILVAAERLHSLPALGRQIRRAVADDLDASPVLTFVNLHPCDLDDDELYSASAPLTRHAHRVVLEITERASLDTVSEPARKFAALRKLGFRLAIDDLGAGYAGLTSVVTLEPEFVKLDMSLVRGIATSRSRRALVRLLVDMAKAIDADVVAEGIETEEERSVLTELGCVLMQGYLFGRAERHRADAGPAAERVTTSQDRGRSALSA